MRRAEDARARAVVLLELHDVCARVALAEVEDVAPIRPSPAVDALVVVADDGEIAVHARERMDQPELRVVRVLELVDEDVAEAAAHLLAELVVLLERQHEPVDEVTEVHGSGAFLPGLVLVGDLRGDVLVVAAQIVAVRDLLHLLLGALDRLRDLAWREALGVDVEVAHHPLQERLLVGVVVDREVAADADLVAVLPEQPRAHRVEGADHQPARAARDELGEPLAHLAGRLVGEGDGEDAPGRHVSLPDEVRDPVGDHAGLATPGSGEDHERAIAIEHCLLLGLVQSIEHAPH